MKYNEEYQPYGKQGIKLLPFLHMWIDILELDHMPGNIVNDENRKNHADYNRELHHVAIRREWLFLHYLD